MESAGTPKVAPASIGYRACFRNQFGKELASQCNARGRIFRLIRPQRAPTPHTLRMPLQAEDPLRAANPFDCFHNIIG